MEVGQGLLGTVKWVPAEFASRTFIGGFSAAATASFSTPNFAPFQWLHQFCTGCPSLCSARGIEVWQLRHGQTLCVDHRRLLPVSRFTANKLGLQLEVIVHRLLLFNSFDQARFCPGPVPKYLLKRYGLSPHQPVVFTLSRLSKDDSYKNIDKLIAALPALLTSFPIYAS